MDKLPTTDTGFCPTKVAYFSTLAGIYTRSHTVANFHI